MDTPDQSPLKIGEVYYLKRVSVYHQCTLRSLHEFGRDNIKVAKVDYYAEGEPVICRQSELITEEQYKAVMKQRAEEAYERDLPLRRERAKAKYAELVQMVTDKLPRDEIAKRLNKPAVSVGQMIAAAKRWGLIVEDKQPDAKPPTA